MNPTGIPTDQLRILCRARPFLVGVLGVGAAEGVLDLSAEEVRREDLSSVAPTSYPAGDLANCPAARNVISTLPSGRSRKDWLGCQRRSLT